ncbi:MAG: RNA polymerase sigma-70 factor (ECF subfamily), partial [Pseudohongiellaceae bacterium]
MTNPHHIDDLLSHSHWVRHLAKSLLFDQAHVDDVVQQTWVVALQREPSQPESIRAWLAGIVRNLARRQGRSDSRRRQRETAVSGRDNAPSTDDLVSLADSQARVVDAVVSLSEPYRTTVLLRYFEDLSSEQIAKQLGV